MRDGRVRDRSIYEFGEVRVDMGRMAAIRGDAAIPLEPKAFDVLVHLIEHRDRVVTKEELLDAVWEGTFVTPNVLTRAVAQIRKALGDESQDAAVIETVAKRGYRFIAPVTVSTGVAPVTIPDAGPAMLPAPGPRSWATARVMMVALLGAAAVLMAIAYLR